MSFKFNIDIFIVIEVNHVGIVSSVVGLFDVGVKQETNYIAWFYSMEHFLGFWGDSSRGLYWTRGVYEVRWAIFAQKRGTLNWKYIINFFGTGVQLQCISCFNSRSWGGVGVFIAVCVKWKIGDLQTFRFFLVYIKSSVDRLTEGYSSYLECIQANLNQSGSLLVHSHCTCHISSLLALKEDPPRNPLPLDPPLPLEYNLTYCINKKVLFDFIFKNQSFHYFMCSLFCGHLRTNWGFKLF